MFPQCRCFWRCTNKNCQVSYVLPPKKWYYTELIILSTLYLAENLEPSFALHKIPKFHITFSCRSFVETLRKLCVSTKFLPYGIRWDYCILCNVDCLPNDFALDSVTWNDVNEFASMFIELLKWHMRKRSFLLTSK